MLWLGCRHACFGSAEASLPALLPFIACLPRSLLGPSPAALAQVSLGKHSYALWEPWWSPLPCAPAPRRDGLGNVLKGLWAGS